MPRRNAGGNTGSFRPGPDPSGGRASLSHPSTPLTGARRATGGASRGDRRSRESSAEGGMLRPGTINRDQVISS
jgi:hypothetical protein